jgi:hypothetical protein
MATKKQPVAKKSSTAKKASTTTKSASRRISPKMLYTEKHPERHQATGKYKFFYILFACTTIFFAALSVELFVFASEIQNKYESIDACVRAHTRCSVRADENEIKVEGNEQQ